MDYTAPPKTDCNSSLSPRVLAATELVTGFQCYCNSLVSMSYIFPPCLIHKGCESVTANCYRAWLFSTCCRDLRFRLWRYPVQSLLLTLMTSHSLESSMLEYTHMLQLLKWVSISEHKTSCNKLLHAMIMVGRFRYLVNAADPAVAWRREQKARQCNPSQYSPQEGTAGIRLHMPPPP